MDYNVGSGMIKVIGVGGGGSDVVNALIRGLPERIDPSLPEVVFIAAGMEKAVLDGSLAQRTIWLGEKRDCPHADSYVATERAYQIVRENRNVWEAVGNYADFVLVIAHMDGSDDSEAAAAIAEIARELGTVVIGIALAMPFSAGGSWRARSTAENLKRFRENSNILIFLPLEGVMALAPARGDALRKKADDLVCVAVRAIFAILGIIPSTAPRNLDGCNGRLWWTVDSSSSLSSFIENELERHEPDFVASDMQACFMDEGGPAMMGVGGGRGETPLWKVAERALHSPLCKAGFIGSAHAIILTMAASRDLGRPEILDAYAIIEKAVSKDADIFFNVVVDGSLGDAMRVTVIAVGGEDEEMSEMHVADTGHDRLDDDMDVAAGSQPLAEWQTPAAETPPSCPRGGLSYENRLLLELYWRRQEKTAHFQWKCAKRSGWGGGDVWPCEYFSFTPEYGQSRPRVMIVGEQANGLDQLYWNGEECLDKARRFLYGPFPDSPFWHDALELAGRLLGRERGNMRDIFHADIFRISYDNHLYAFPDLVEEYFSGGVQTLTDEIAIAAPDVLVFLTRPSFDQYLERLFPGLRFEEEDPKIRGAEIDACRLVHPALPCNAFRTWRGAREGWAAFALSPDTAWQASQPEGETEE